MPMWLSVLGIAAFAVWVFGIRPIPQGRFAAVFWFGHEIGIKFPGLRWVPPGSDLEVKPLDIQHLEIELPPAQPALPEEALYPDLDGRVRTWHELTESEQALVLSDRLSQPSEFTVRATLFWRYVPSMYFVFRKNVGSDFERKITEVARSAIHDDLGLVTIRTAIRRKPYLGELFAQKVRIMSGEVPDPATGKKRLSWGITTESGIIGPVILSSEVAKSQSEKQALIYRAEAEEEYERKLGRGRAAGVESLREVMARPHGEEAAALDTSRRIITDSKNTEKVIVAPPLAGLAATGKEITEAMKKK